VFEPRQEWLRHNVRCDLSGSTVKLRVGSGRDFSSGEAQGNREEAVGWERPEDEQGAFARGVWGVARLEDCGSGRREAPSAHCGDS
jgi:hypothetical protein